MPITRNVTVNDVYVISQSLCRNSTRRVTLGTRLQTRSRPASVDKAQQSRRIATRSPDRAASGSRLAAQAPLRVDLPPAPCEMVRTLSSSSSRVWRRPPSAALAAGATGAATRKLDAALRAARARAARARPGHHRRPPTASRQPTPDSLASTATPGRRLGAARAARSPMCPTARSTRSPRCPASAASASTGRCAGRWSGRARRSARRWVRETPRLRRHRRRRRDHRLGRHRRGTTISAPTASCTSPTSSTSSPPPYDDYGHGTHVAGIIAGNGYDSNGAPPRHRAGRARCVVAQGARRDGHGYISNVIAALDYAVANTDAHSTSASSTSRSRPASTSRTTPTR